MKSVADGLDSISVSQSIFSLPSVPLIYLLLFSFPLLCATSETVTPLQSAVLAKLGLTTPPTLDKPALPVPDHFWNLYRKVKEGMLDEDSIRLFYPQELIDLNSGLLLSYNLSIEAQQAQKEKVVNAHLKLRIRGGRGSVRVYRVEDLSRLRVERLLDSVELREGEEERVIDLDVTEGVPYINQKHAVRLLVVLPSDCEMVDSPTQSLSSIAHSRAASAAMVVTYAEGEGHQEEEENEHPKRRKRSNSEEERRKERKERKRKNRKHRTGGEKSVCHRKSMYVDFDELKWRDWIFAPTGYEAYQCSGGCPYPFPKQVNASNHAIIQGLLHNYNDEIPEPCCVPTELAPLSILFMETSNRIVIKSYPDMVVMACGCR